MRVGAVVLLILCLPALAFASRASQEGRALPRLLSEDVSLARFLPGVLSGQDRFFLVDVGGNATPWLAPGLASGNDDLAMALVGDRVRFGYILDGSTHNLVLTGRAGWGVVLGVTDGFKDSRDEAADTSITFSAEAKTEVSRRVVRLGAGWTFGSGTGRTFSVGTGVTYLDVDYTFDFTRITEFEVQNYHAVWNSSPGLGFDLTFQSVSPGPGLQIGGQLRFEDLHGEGTLAAPIPPRRRYASLQAGWRVDTQAVDDLILGVTASWQLDTSVSAYASTYSYPDISTRETTDYLGGVFLSAEHEVRKHLRVRGGIVGPARFHDVKVTHTRVDSDGTQIDTSDDSVGEVNSLLVALGLSWTWKSWLLEAQVNRYLNTDSPIVSWAATLAF